MIRIYKKTLKNKIVSLEKNPSAGCWISVVSPTEKEINTVVSQYNIPKEFIIASLDNQEISRIDRENGTILFIYKIPLAEYDGKNFKTLTLGIIFAAKLIITIISEHHLLIDDFGSDRIKNFYTTTKTRFLLQFSHRINFYFINYLNFLEENIKRTEKKLLSSFENKQIVGLLKYQKSLTFFNTAILTNNNVLEKLAKGSVVKLYEDDRDLLDDAIIENKQALEMTKIYSSILSGTMDAYASIISNNLNIVMKFLASVTIIISLPTIIASLFGMNVNLPFQNNPVAFVIVLFIAFAFMGVLAYLFSKKGYL